MNNGKVLFIAHRIPYPPNKGDKIRSYHMLRHLAEQNQVAVACMIDDLEDVQYIEALKAIADPVFYAVRSTLGMKIKAVEALVSGKPFTRTCFYAHDLQRAIDAYLDSNSVRAIICFCSSAAEYVFRSRHYRQLSAKQVLLADLVDVDSEKWQQYAAQKSRLTSWLFRREAGLLRAYERKIVETFDRTFMVSEAERGVLAQHCAVDKVEALSNGVELDYFSPEKARPRTGHDPANKLVFSGAMDYWPNIEGAVWFATNVFPEVRRATPDAVFCIAGRNPADAVVALGKQPGIEITGTVPDMRDYLASAALCVVPLQIARGIQNKVLEGMAMGKAVVATQGAATGLHAVPGQEIVVADNAADMTAAVIALLGNPEQRQSIGTKARQYVEREHSWAVHLFRLTELINAGKGSPVLSAQC